MLNETASSTEDRPVARTPARVEANDDHLLYHELRGKVATIFAVERETFDPNPMEVFRRDNIVLMSQETRLIASFEGRLLLDSEEAFGRLDTLLAADDFYPMFRVFGDQQVVHIFSGRAHPQPRSSTLNIILFAVTIFSVLWLGTEMAINEIAANVDPHQAQALVDNMFLNLWRGIPYAASILLILGAHELGHYFAARHHRLAVTLPYFIPAPFISFLGTFGAFIQLREPIRSRKVLLDVGAAGPLAGLIFAIPILFIGLKTSTVGPIMPGGALEGNSLLYALAKVLVFGRFVPDGQYDVYINQLAMAGWAGLLVTALNLIPIGQLDGGHVLFSLVGSWARKVYWPLMIVSFLLAIRNPTWILWAVLLLLFGRIYAAPLDMITPLDRRRKFIAVLSLIVFFFIFVPEPLTISADVAAPAPHNSVMLIPMVTASLVLLWQRLRR